ncbi:MAG: sigma-54 dependent transcriptional regulator [Desulfobacteraceae bacterium]|nr:sigma-54 dependent transcriptional regulator [Pseudomonadota bacterium]MBU4259007.1 sigma-54 dependent transcriptional regulator [Pseudomonadota bacterium]MCG2758871.1 sigma-54 dependent transcriptional regulator [Desulfobacteraceae bacterium]
MSVENQASLQKNILVVDDDHDFRWAIGNVLRAGGYKVTQAQNGEEALKLLEKYVPDLILLDYRMPGQDGISVSADIKKIIPALPIIMITAYAEVESAVKAMKTGVYDYVTKPVDNNDLLFAIKRALEQQELVQEVERLRNVLNERASLYKLMGNSDRISELVKLIEKVAPTPFTVLIEGESGTGKELVARSIHDLSVVNKGPFIAVDCGAIPENLIESELFGYMKGAFTGAFTDKPGQFELADKGTLFLDEIGNLLYQAQQKILRAMQERCIQRLGAKKAKSIQVRVIAATNQPLEKDIESGKFRSDLYFRLKEFSIKVPALRERKEDIPYLAKKFMNEVQLELDKKCGGISKAVLQLLVSCQWPGNVRELRNIIRQAVLLCEENSSIKPKHLTFTSNVIPYTSEINSAFSNKIYGEKKSLSETVKSISQTLEKKIITEMLAETKGNKSEAARRLGIDYKTLLRKIKTYQLNNSDQ